MAKHEVEISQRLTIISFRMFVSFCPNTHYGEQYGNIANQPQSTYFCDSQFIPLQTDYCNVFCAAKFRNSRQGQSSSTRIEYLCLWKFIVFVGW